MLTKVPLRVVFVDDDPDLVQLVRIAVAGERDFELVATSCEAAAVLDLVREHQPDVVILDHRLSELREPRTQTGLELVAYTRVAIPDATIAIFTGRRGLQTAARNAGADVLVEKPAPLDALWSAIREYRATAGAGV